jgi:hypothetical protein
VVSHHVSHVSESTKHAILLVALLVVVLITAWSGRVSEGRKSLEACDAAAKRGDRVEAIVFARAAAEARCPFCSAPELGFARLYAIAKEAESRGDDAIAVAAWRAVRAATLASVVLDTTPARRERADNEIARLEHRIDAAAAAAGGTASPAASEERLRVALAASTVPSTTVFVLLALGGVLFLVGGVRFVRAAGAATFGTASVVMAAAGAGVAIAGVLLF